MPFTNILGQGHAIGVIKKIIASKNIASSYLFSGPEGVGKRATAIALAQALNCERGGMDACGECPVCMAIERKNYGEVIVLEPQGPVRRHHIDTIREMQNFVNLRSSYGRWKAVIIDEAERMTEEAAASILKILEEPPTDTIFILVSSRPQDLFETIRSRCQQIKFLPLSRELHRGLIQDCLKKRGVDTKIRDEILAISNGGVGKALMLLSPEREMWRRGLLNWRFAKGDVFSISQKIVDGIDSDAKQDFVMDALHLFFTWFRDVLFVKEGLGEALNSDYAAEIKEEARVMGLSSIMYNLEAIARAERDIMRQVNPRLVLDTLFLRLAKSVP